MDAFVLARLTTASMPDNPPADWHARVHRMAAALAQAHGIGGTMRNLWWTLGPYDLVIVADVPSPQAAAAFALTLSRKLRAETTTLLTLDEHAMDDVMHVVG